MKVLVITARGLQTGAVGAYGNTWLDTPALDRLAAGGVVFDWHFADRADAAGARRAWRSGRYDLPTPGGATAPTPAEVPDLVRALRARGIHTWLIVDASRPSPPEFEAGWDQVERVTATAEETALESAVSAAEAALRRLAGRDGWLLWVDLATPLPPWDVPEEFQAPYFEEAPPDEAEEGEEDEAAEESGPDEEEEELEPILPLPDPAEGPIDPDDDILFERLQSSYAGAVSYLDAGVGQLLETLAQTAGADVLVVVSADVGQALGEHGVVGPVRPWPHDEVIHLPLILRLPGAAEAGRRVAALTQAADLGPTLADAFGVPLPDAQGKSLLPLARGQAEQVRDYVCAGREVGGIVEWCLRTPDWSFLLPAVPDPGGRRGPQLYVKPDDRWEVNNVLQHHLERAEALEQTLRAFVAAARQPGPLVVPPLREMEEAESAAGR
jgi:arylsulfatase A-like enzyme